ncbi:MAG: sulfatase-like hydrolase/transferase [Planctomycetota bacterium]|nr:sulfatase-like hydrolase/transferase [Planctomycetota bacterium]
MGVANNTLVIFTSDNGGTKSARPSGLRGIKGTTFEGGIRVPCIVRWQGVLKAGLYTNPAMSFDLTASMLLAAGLDISGLDGVDVLGEIAQNLPSTDRDLFLRQRRGNRTWQAVREEPLNLVVEQQGTKEEEFLFDVTNDSAEVKNLIEERPEDALRLRAKLQAWEQAVKPKRP